LGLRKKNKNICRKQKSLVSERTTCRSEFILNFGKNTQPRGLRRTYIAEHSQGRGRINGKGLKLRELYEKNELAVKWETGGGEKMLKKNGTTEKKNEKTKGVAAVVGGGY